MLPGHSGGADRQGLTEPVRTSRISQFSRRLIGRLGLSFNVDTADTVKGRDKIVFACEENAKNTVDRCPMLVPGGVQCTHKATVVPRPWEVPPYCVPGKAICSCCYGALKAKALGNACLMPEKQAA